MANLQPLPLYRRMRRLAFSAPLMLLPLAGGCRGADPSASAAPRPAARTVGVVRPARGDVARAISQPATIQGIDEATLYAKTSGYLKAIYVDKGDRVKAGQLLAVIESPELLHAQEQARSTYRQSQASTRGAIASRGRAQADVAQAASAVDKSRADADQAAAGVGRARAEQARVEAQVPKLQALVQEADANIQQASEQQAQAQAEVARWQQQVKGSQAAVRTAQAALAKAQADSRLQQITYNRYKAIKDEDPGLVATQQVDEARARMETSQSEVEAARNKVETAKQDLATVEQRVEEARRGAAAAANKVSAAKNHSQAARDDVEAARSDVEAARQQVRVALAQQTAAQRQIRVVDSQRRALGEQVGVADAQIAAARQQSQGSRSAMETAASLADYTRIVAPFDGVITERLADPGALVQNASSSQAAARGIVKVVRDRSVRVMIPVPESAIPFIRKGQPAAVLLDAYPKQPFSGTVTRFASAVDPKSRTMLTEVDISNDQGRLHPGMYAVVALTLETHRNALSIPSAAVMGKEDHFLYTVEGGRAHKKPVTVGVDDGKMAEITDGLQPDSQVVVVGQDTLVDGATVKAEPVKPESAKAERGKR